MATDTLAGRLPDRPPPSIPPPPLFPPLLALQARAEEPAYARPARLLWPTDRAARAIANAIGRGKREAVIAGHGKFIAFAGRHLPVPVAAVLACLRPLDLCRDELFQLCALRSARHR